jgi:hypothetical protein
MKRKESKPKQRFGLLQEITVSFGDQTLECKYVAHDKAFFVVFKTDGDRSFIYFIPTKRIKCIMFQIIEEEFDVEAFVSDVTTAEGKAHD